MESSGCTGAHKSERVQHPEGLYRINDVWQIGQILFGDRGAEGNPADPTWPGLFQGLESSHGFQGFSQGPGHPPVGVMISRGTIQGELEMKTERALGQRPG